MKEESVIQKVIKLILILSGIVIITYGLKDTGWDSEEIYCIGPGLILLGVMTSFWLQDKMKPKLESKRILIKIIEIILFTVGITILTYGLKDTSWDAEEISIIGGVLIGIGYGFRDLTLEKEAGLLSNTTKLFVLIFALSIITFQSSIYSNSEDCNCENQLNDIENKIERLDRN